MYITYIIGMVRTKCHRIKFENGVMMIMAMVGFMARVKVEVRVRFLILIAFLSVAP